MNRLLVVLLIALTAVPLLAGPARADEEGQLVVTSLAEVEREVVNDKGEKEMRRLKAERVLPGETVIFTNTLHNTGEKPAQDVVINNPVPQHMVYVEGSAFGEQAAITFSADGGESFDRPDNLTVTWQGGGTRPARVEDYTHIRWEIEGEIPPGQATEVGFRARLK